MKGIKNTLSFVSIFVLSFCATNISFASTTIPAVLTATVVPATVKIHLTVITNTETLYDKDENVSPCISVPGSGKYTISGYCAVLQSGLQNDWSWWGSDAFLNSLGGVSNDFSNPNTYWAFFSNLNYENDSLSAYELKQGDNILLSYNINPLKLTASNLNPKQNDNITLTLSKFSLDLTSYNPIWIPVSDGNIIINGASTTVSSIGEYSFTATSLEPYFISGKKTGFIDSNTIILTPSVAVNSGGLKSNDPVIVSKSFDVSKAISYLLSNQGSDGSIAGSSLYTDWAGVAVGSTENSEVIKAKIISYLNSNNHTSSYLTENERRSITLLSLGQNPYSFGGVDYITPIVNSFDGNQFGDSNLFNDDVFAILVLENAGYTSSDSIITKDVSFIISKQQSNGSWGGVDMTAAAIMALKPLSDIDGVSSSISKASVFLENSQGFDGGWGNVSSSSWAFQAMSSLGANWIKNGKSVSDYFASQQSVDGAALPNSESIQNRVWTTSYAIPAVLGKSWGNIMHPVPRPITIGADTIKIDIPKTEIVISTTTKDIATSTISKKETKEIVSTSTIIKIFPQQSNLNKIIGNVISPKKQLILEKKIVSNKIQKNGFELSTSTIDVSSISANVETSGAAELIGKVFSNIKQKIFGAFSFILKIFS